MIVVRNIINSNSEMEALKALMSKKKEELKSTKLIDQGEVERKRQAVVR